MATNQEFIKSLENQIPAESKDLIIEFFITFSRFECALKAAGFANGNAETVSANWDTFVASIRERFIQDRTDELMRAVDYILQEPPRIQVLAGGRLGWMGRNFQGAEPLINRLGLSIRDIRNNLFHGGKFNGNYAADISRNYILLRNAIVILNEWLELSPEVKADFLRSIH